MADRFHYYYYYYWWWWLVVVVAAAEWNSKHVVVVAAAAEWNSKYVYYFIYVFTVCHRRRQDLIFWPSFHP
jgi:hypothetical protein